MEKHFWDDIYKRDSIIGNKDLQTLYRAKQISDNDSFVTIKEYLIKKGDDSNNKKVKELYGREIELMKELSNSNCENFVKFIDCKEDFYREREDNFYYIIREYCLGNLEEFITMNENKLEPKFIQLIMKQLNNAFKILRDKNIIHRNIKPSNILFCYKEDTNFIMKLSGLNYYKKGNDGCPSINNNDFPNPSLNNEDEKYDLWSIGVIMYFMYFGDYKNINKIPQINDKDLKDLINKCINNRISWNEYFNHPFFKNYYSNEDDDEGINDNDIDLLEKYIDELKSFTDIINKDYIKFNKERDKQEKKKLIKSHYDKLKKEFNNIDSLNTSINDLFLNLNKK